MPLRAFFGSDEILFDGWAGSSSLNRRLAASNRTLPEPGDRRQQQGVAVAVGDRVGDVGPRVLLRPDVQGGGDAVAAALEPALPVVGRGAELLAPHPPAVEVVAEEAPLVLRHRHAAVADLPDLLRNRLDRRLV